jgi:uncharacterized protein with HEPN domain
MRREALKRLHDALEAIEAIQRFIENCTLDHYLDNELIQSAVERKFEIIGESLKRAQEPIPALWMSFPTSAASWVHATESSMATKPWIS